MELREAAQMALEALQESKPIDIDDPAAFYRSAHAIEALRAALENEFNPDWDAMAVMVEVQQRMAKRIEELESALAQPEQIISQEWQPANPDANLRHYSLVLRDLDKTIEGWCEQPEFYLDGKRIDVTQQKPVAWRKKWEGDEDYTYYWMCRYKDSEPLYTAPPQREWQGLTDEEIKDTLEAVGMDTWFSYRHAARAIEAKLKEKNGG